MSRASAWTVAAAAVVATGLLGCGGGGGGSSCDACENVAGTWETTETVNAVACGEGTYTDYGLYTVTQSGCDLQVTPYASGVTFDGSICGDQLSWTGTYPMEGGTNRITSMSLTVSGPALDGLAGTAYWTWSGSGDSCSGSTYISGERY